MPNPLNIYEDSGRVIIKISGELTDDKIDVLKEEVLEGEKLIKDTYRRTGNKVSVLIDMSEFTGKYDTQAMEIMAGLANADREFVAKTAGFGGSEIANVVGEITAALANRDNIKFFATEAEALA